MFFPKKHVLVTYGDTALLEGITQALHESDVLTVRSLSLRSDATALTVQRPDLILVDAAQITASQVESLVSVFSPNPAPPILSLDSNTQRLTALSARQYPTASLEELEQALEIILRPLQSQGESNETSFQ